MRADQRGQHYVLTLYPTTHGMAYMLFEGPLSLVDWGKSGATGTIKNERCLEMTKRLIERYVPDVIVLEDTSRLYSKRSPRIRLLNRGIATLAGIHGIDVTRFGGKEIRKAFDRVGSRTKQERARAIAEMLPALSHRVPPKRKAWMAEDPRMSLFEAAALGIAYYGQH